MKTLEDRIRMAAAQTAGEIALGSIRPLSLSGQLASGRHTRAGRAAKPGPRSARWPRVLFPIAAARAHVGQPGASGSQPTRAPQILSAASRAALASVPEFYIAMTPAAWA